MELVNAGFNDSTLLAVDYFIWAMHLTLVATICSIFQHGGISQNRAGI